MSTESINNFRGGAVNVNNIKTINKEEVQQKAKFISKNNHQRPHHSYNLRSRANVNNCDLKLDLNNNILSSKNDNFNALNNQITAVTKTKCKLATSNANFKKPVNLQTSTTAEIGEMVNGGAVKRGFDVVDTMDGDQDLDEDLESFSLPSCMTLDRKSPPKKAKPLITYREMIEFFNLLNQDSIDEFLKRDACCLISDKYALAMVFMYFKRARLSLEEYTSYNFYLALYLASDIEEDVDDYKYEIFPWALGPKWRTKFSGFLRKRDALLRRIGYRAIVSRKCCEEVMNLVPDHYAWKRERSEDHGGATRAYLIYRSRRFLSNKGIHEEEEINLPRGPTEKARPCPLCLINRSSLNINFGKFISPSNPTIRPALMSFSKLNPSSMAIHNQHVNIISQAPLVETTENTHSDVEPSVSNIQEQSTTSFCQITIEDHKVETKLAKTPQKVSITQPDDNNSDKENQKNNDKSLKNKNLSINVNINIINDRGSKFVKQASKYRNRSSEQTTSYIPVSPKIASNLSKLNPSVKYPSLASVNYLYVKDQPTSDEYDDEDEQDEGDEVFEKKNSPRLLVLKSQLKKHEHFYRLNNRRALHFQNKLHAISNAFTQNYFHHHHHHHYAKKRMNISLSANAALSLTSSIDSISKQHAIGNIAVNDQLVPRNQQTLNK